VPQIRRPGRAWKPLLRQRFFPRYPEKPVTAYIYARILQFRPQNMEQFPRLGPRPPRQNQLLYKRAARLTPLPLPPRLVIVLFISSQASGAVSRL
jgi:hypothetical protein